MMDSRKCRIILLVSVAVVDTVIESRWKEAVNDVQLYTHASAMRVEELHAKSEFGLCSAYPHNALVFS